MLEIKINGKNYTNFNNVSIELTYDAIASTFSFDGYFDPKNIEHRELYRPLSFHNIQIFKDKKLILTGYILSHKFKASAVNQLVPVSGYSKTGILSDVSIPTDKYPLEANNRSLYDICLRLCKPFGITVVIDDDAVENGTKLYEKSTSEGKGSIAEYLAEIACQRNLIITHTAGGALRIARPRTQTASIATYSEGMPSVDMEIGFDGQGMHSELSVLRESTVGSSLEGESKKINPIIRQYRPLVKEQSKGDAGDTENATENAISGELKSIVLTINTDRWEWFDGRKYTMIKPDHYIKVQSPSCFLSKPSDWFVQKVVLTENTEGRTATLTCVMPETFTENQPKNIFS